MLDLRGLISGIGEQFKALGQLPSTISKARESAGIAKTLKLKLGGLVKEPEIITPPVVPTGKEDVYQKVNLALRKTPEILTSIKGVLIAKSESKLEGIIEGRPIGLDDPLAKAIEKGQREFVVPMLKGFYGESIYNKIIEPSLPEHLKGEPTGKILPVVGKTAGWMAAFGTVAGAYGKLMTTSQFGRTLITQTPKIAGAIQTLGAGLTIDQLQSPLESTLQERKKIFYSGLPLWVGFGVAGGIATKKVSAWLPTIFGGQFLSSKLDGKSNEEAFKDSLTMATIFSLFKIAELPKNPQTILREQAAKELGIKPTATLSEATKARTRINREFSPNSSLAVRQGTVDEVRVSKANQAYDVLIKTPKQLQSDIFTEIRDYYNYLKTPEGRKVALTILNEIPIGLSIKAVPSGTPKRPEEIEPVERVGGVPEVPRATPEDWNKLNELQKDLNMPKPIAERADRAIAKLMKEKDFSQPLAPTIPKEPQPLAEEAIPKFEAIKDWRTKIGDSTITQSWVSANGENFVNVKLPSGRNFNVKYDILIGKEKPINTQQISDLKDLMMGEQRLGITDVGVYQPAVGKMVEDFKLKSPSVMKRPIVVVADGKGGLRIEEGQHRFTAAKIANVEPPIVLLNEKQMAGLNASEVDALARKVYTGKNESQLTDFWDKAQAVRGEVKVPPVGGEGLPTIPEQDIIPPTQIVSSIEKLSQDEGIVNRVKKEVIDNDLTGLVQDSNKPIEPEPELITTRKFKQTEEWQDFAKYAEEKLMEKDIHPAVLFRHVSLTAERVAEFLDGGINGEVYKKIIKPVYDSAEKVNKEGDKIKKEFKKFKIVEGGSSDNNASLFAQKKLDKASPKEMEAAKYVRDKYDEFLVRLNGIRAKLGVEPIPKRSDYITHINELNVLSELFGGIDRITVKTRISELKNELLDKHPDWTEARAFDAAKRGVEGLTGIAKYVDARQPSFRFAKQRLTDYEKSPSIIGSFNTYVPSALRYIYQAENVARNKAFKDVLPANAKEFIRLWNTEQVAGRVPSSVLGPQAKRVLSAIRGTLGANTILGNLATTMMQLTSFPQVFALAGIRNTAYGITKRLWTYLASDHSLWNVSRSKSLRNLNIDIGLGDSILDSFLVKIGNYEKLRNPVARSRQAIDLGRRFLMSIMETADQFTVGATYEAFYRKATLDGLSPNASKEYADIMTGKTQANYFKEALPPFLNTVEGKIIGQFGTYTMNQWEMVRKDLGKTFADGGKSQKSLRSMFGQFMKFLTAAYLIDTMSEKTFGRQPYDIKSFIDEAIKAIEGEATLGELGLASLSTVGGFVPFMGSVKFKSMPPVLDFGGDVVSAILGSGATQQTAINDLSEKWIYNILLPYGGNQLRKTLQGVEKVSGEDLPFVKNTSKKFNISTNIDAAKAILFGPSATQASIDYYNKKDSGGISIPSIKIPSMKIPSIKIPSMKL